MPTADEIRSDQDQQSDGQQAHRQCTDLDDGVNGPGAHLFESQIKGQGQGVDFDEASYELEYAIGDQCKT